MSMTRGPSPDPERIGERRFRWLVWLAGAVWALLIHWPVLLGQVPLPAELLLDSPAWRQVSRQARTVEQHAEMGDAITQGYPWYAQRRERLLDGDVPLWNERALMGTPFLAASQPGVFNPLPLLLLPLPSPIGWSLLVVFKTWLSFVFTAFAARRLGAVPLGALAGGAAFSGCGFMTAWSLWCITDSAIWLPAILWASALLNQKPTLRSCLVTGVTLALPVLAGHAEIAAFATMTGALFALFLTLFGPVAPGRSRLVFPALFALSAVIGVGLASVQLLPTFEWLGSIARSSDSPLRLALPADDIVGIVSRDSQTNPSSLGVSIPEGASYAGIAALLIAPLAALAHLRLALFLYALGASAAAVSFSLPPFFDLYQLIPFLRAAPANRLLLLTDLCLALLLALGLTRLAALRPNDPDAPRARSLLRLTSLVVGFLIAAILTRSSSARAGALDFPNGVGTSLALLIAFALLARLALAARDDRLRSRRVAWIVALTGLDLATFAGGHLPYFEPADVFPLPGVLRWIGPDVAARYRVASVDSVMPVNSAQYFGFRDPVGYDYPLRTTVRMLRPLTQGSSGFFILDSLSSESLAALRGSRFRLTNTRYLIASRLNGSTQRLEAAPSEFRLAADFGLVQVLEVSSALPRAWWIPANGLSVVETVGQALAVMDGPDFDPVSEGVLVGAARNLVEPMSRNPTGRAPNSISQLPVEVEIRSDGDRREATVAAEAPGLVVVSEAYDRGWRATVDGVRSPVLRTNAALLGVPVAAGAHRIRLEYRPPSFFIGASISVATLVIAALLYLVDIRRRASTAIHQPDRL